MNIDEPSHACSVNCLSHVQPSFQRLGEDARDALQSLFSNPLCETAIVSDRLFFARRVGLALGKMYVTFLLLSTSENEQVTTKTFIFLVPGDMSNGVFGDVSSPIWRLVPI